MAIDVRRREQRYSTQTPWLDSHHCFSFGHHYDPSNTGFGTLLVSNDDVVAPGTGFDTHPHRDMEIVTWVLDGALVHQDSQGNNGIIYPGLAQRMSAGRGILHSEKNDSWRIDGSPVHDNPVHFIQMWVLPDEAGIDPGYEQLDINDALVPNQWVVVASGMAKHANDRAIRIRQKDAGLSVIRLEPDATTNLPDEMRVHLYVARGDIQLEGAGTLSEGDSVRLTGASGPAITAGPSGAELLTWQMST